MVGVLFGKYSLWFALVPVSAVSVYLVIYSYLEFWRERGSIPANFVRRFGSPGAELLFQLLASRYETSSTMVTSNLMFSEWVRIFHDKALTAALLDRITHRALILNMTGTVTGSGDHRSCFYARNG